MNNTMHDLMIGLIISGIMAALFGGSIATMIFIYLILTDNTEKNERKTDASGSAQ